MYYLGAVYNLIGRSTLAVSSYLKFIFTVVTKFEIIDVFFFLTNNNCVNAKFLSRYIARKLRQGYSVKDLLNPIRKELVYLLAISMMSNHSYYVLKLKRYKHAFLKNKMIKNYHKMLISNSFLQYLLIRKNMVNNSYTLFTLDLAVIFIWINYTLSNKFLYSKTNYIIDNFKTRKKIINFSIEYFKKKMIYVCLFENKSFIKNLNYLIFPKLNGSFLLFKKQKFEYFLS
jgi:hypothetical protein